MVDGSKASLKGARQVTWIT